MYFAISSETDAEKPSTANQSVCGREKQRTCLETVFYRENRIPLHFFTNTSFFIEEALKARFQQYSGCTLRGRSLITAADFLNSRGCDNLSTLRLQSSIDRFVFHERTNRRQTR